MNYELTLHIREDSRAGRNIEAMARTEHLSREDAALKLLEARAAQTPRPTSAERRAAVEAITGSLKDIPWIIDDFDAERQADIERENKRDLAALSFLR